MHCSLVVLRRRHQKMFMRPPPGVATAAPCSEANNASVLFQDGASADGRGNDDNVDNSNSNSMEPPARMVDKRHGGVVASVTGGKESVGTSSDTTAVDVRMPVAVVTDSMMDGAMELEPAPLSLSTAKQVYNDMSQGSSHPFRLLL